MIVVEKSTGDNEQFADGDSYIVGENGELDVMVGVVAIQTFAPHAWNSAYVRRTPYEVEAINKAASAADDAGKETAGWGMHGNRD